MNKQRKRGYSITSQGQVLIEQKRQEKGYTREKLAEVAGISIDTLKSLQRRENKDQTTIEAVSVALEIKPTDIVDPNEWYQQSENKVKNESNIYSVNICYKMLEKQQEQQNNRRKASFMGYELDFPPVPLGLVERKQQQRRNENVEREDIYKLESEVITKTYQHDEFLEQIINKNDHRKNKHIAIVGEPGAGKTTLLNAIATYIKKETQDLPIFISLGSLQGMTLTDYVIKRWLPDAARLVNVNAVINTEVEEQFKSEFYQGKFWLLLDGVDEMGESSPIQALNKIAQELTNWLGQARVILTCRLNVWDATTNNNILPGFTTFKTQEFTPEDVEKFIRDWFAKANKISHGEKLIAQLREEGKERIRELVTNPLRLSLLCQIFDQDENGELPETKAQFYQLFTRYFYEWKPELVPDLITSYELREELHRALGNLALAGINSDVRFRLKRSFAVKAMGDERLFNLACEVGWLNTDTHSLLTQLQPTNKTYSLPLNLKTLQNETDIIEISQEICNQIYFTAFTEPEEIPAVNNAPQLKSKIPQIKKHLKTENLALIINNCEPNETIINFCNKLTDVLHIAFITEQPLNPPLRGFPQQQNLLNTIQNWINEIE